MNSAISLTLELGACKEIELFGTFGVEFEWVMNGTFLKIFTQPLQTLLFQPAWSICPLQCVNKTPTDLMARP